MTEQRLRELPEDPPEFEHDLDETTLPLFKSERDLNQAKLNSVRRQQIEWLFRYTIKTHNLAVQHEKSKEETRRSIMGIPVKVITSVLTAGAGAVLVKLLDTLK